MDFIALNFMKNALANSIAVLLIKRFSLHFHKDSTVDVVIRFREKIATWHIEFIHKKKFILSHAENFEHEVATQQQLLEYFFKRLMILYSETYKKE